MRDSGCQSNFIITEKAEKAKLDVIDTNVKLKVNGFNASKVYFTKSVKVKLVIGSEIYEVKALCIPSIQIVLGLPGLKRVVDVFSNKGYLQAQ